MSNISGSNTNLMRGEKQTKIKRIKILKQWKTWIEKFTNKVQFCKVIKLKDEGDLQAR